MKRVFMIDCDDFPQYDFEMIHRYIRQRLDPKNKRMEIHSVVLNKESEKLIFPRSVI